MMRFAAILLAFVAAASGIVWTTMSSERQAATSEAQERESADEMLSAFLARESALLGYAESGRPSYLESYRDATASLEDTIDRSSAGANGEELAAIDEQERLSDRWASHANDVITRIRGERPVPAESTQIRDDLVSRFQRANAELVVAVEAESADDHRRSLKRAVLLIVLLTAAFACAGGLLMRSLRRSEQLRQDTESAHHSSQREFAETLQVTESEAEAHALVKRHLERSLTGAEILVLNRNNSQNRLEAATPVELILLPDTPLEGALTLAEKLRADITLVEVPGVDRTITASFGVASFPADAPDGAALVRTADRALYAAKASGRNCVVGSTEVLAATTS